MKKFFTFLLVFSLVFSPVFCTGKRELNLKTIFLKDSKEVTTSLSEKPTQPTQIANSLIQSSTESQTSEKNLADVPTDEIVTEIVTTAIEASNINQATLRSLAVVQAEVNRQASEIDDLTEYTTGLEDDLLDAKETVQKSEVKLAEKAGEIDTLNEKLKAKKSFRYVLVGADYNLNEGYGVGLDFGVKFDNGFMTQLGVSAPIDALNPIGLLDINSYTISTKFGWSW